MNTVNLGRIGFVNKGQYLQNTLYKKNDIVIYNNQVKVCVTEHTSPNSSILEANWDVWVNNIDINYFKRDDATTWINTNPVLDDGELGYETDTGKLKIGDGTLNWNSLSYLIGTKVPENAVFTDTIYDDTAIQAEVNANTAKVGITAQQASDIIANNAKVGITTQQASDIVTNNAKVSNVAHPLVETAVPLGAVFTDTVYNDSDVLKDADTVSPVTGTNKLMTQDDVSGLGGGDMLKSTYDTDNSGIVDNAQLVNGLTVETAVPLNAVFTDTVYDPTTIQSEVDANSAKTGITTQQSNDITANNAKVGITTQQANDITTNNAKNSYPSADSTKLAGIEAGATADQTASEMLTAIKTVDGTGSGLDADLLDGMQPLALPISTATQTALDGKEPADPTILKSANIGVTVQGYSSLLDPTVVEW